MAELPKMKLAAFMRPGSLHHGACDIQVNQLRSPQPLFRKQR